MSEGSTQLLEQGEVAWDIIVSQPDVRRDNAHMKVLTLAWPIHAWPVSAPSIMREGDPLQIAYLKLLRLGIRDSYKLADLLAINSEAFKKIASAGMQEELTDQKGDITERGTRLVAEDKRYHYSSENLQYGYILRDVVRGDVLPIFVTDLGSRSRGTRHTVRKNKTKNIDYYLARNQGMHAEPRKEQIVQALGEYIDYSAGLSIADSGFEFPAKDSVAIIGKQKELVYLTMQVCLRSSDPDELEIWAPFPYEQSALSFENQLGRWFENAFRGLCDKNERVEIAFEEWKKQALRSMPKNRDEEDVDRSLPRLREIECLKYTRKYLVKAYSDERNSSECLDMRDSIQHNYLAVEDLLRNYRDNLPKQSRDLFLKTIPDNGFKEYTYEMARRNGILINKNFAHNADRKFMQGIGKSETDGVRQTAVFLINYGSVSPQDRFILACKRNDQIIKNISDIQRIRNDFGTAHGGKDIEQINDKAIVSKKMVEMRTIVYETIRFLADAIFDR